METSDQKLDLSAQKSATDPGTDRLLDYRLDDNLTAENGRILISGTQALVRLTLMQARLDRARGWNTAGFVSGYRGSPLGGVDQALWKAQTLLDEHRVRFMPAINEELGAAAALGTQRVASDPQRRVEGVFSLWYGKGPSLTCASRRRPCSRTGNRPPPFPPDWRVGINSLYVISGPGSDWISTDIRWSHFHGHRLKPIDGPRFPDEP